MNKSNQRNFNKTNERDQRDLISFHYDKNGGIHKGNRNKGSTSSRNKKKDSRAHLISHQYSKLERTLSRFVFGLVGAHAVTNKIGSQKNLKWSDILTVYAPNTQDKCSICLDEFAAPRLAKCGHSFCTLCLQRMFYHEKLEKLAAVQHSGASTPPILNLWVKCPLCFQTFQLADCKCLRFVDSQPAFKVGQHLDFLLYQRNASSMVMEEVQQEFPSKSSSLLPNFGETSLCQESSEASCSVKFFNETPQHAAKLLDEDLDVCMEQLKEAVAFDNQLEIYLINSAMSSIRSEKSKALRDLSASVFHASSFPSEELKYCYKLKGLFSNVFLNPFNMRCLKKEFGDDWNQIPTKLNKVKVLDVISFDSISEDFLKRYAFLNHLLPASEVFFVEVDLSRVLSQETLDFFSEDFRKRKFERDQQKRFEKKLRNRLKRSSKTIRDEFQAQLNKFNQQNMRMTSRELMGYVQQNNQMDDELKEFLRSTCVNDDSQESDDGSGNLQNTPVEKELKSFAKVVNNNGYFPSLSGPQISRGGKQVAWGPSSSGSRNKVDRKDNWPAIGVGATHTSSKKGWVKLGASSPSPKLPGTPKKSSEGMPMTQPVAPNSVKKKRNQRVNLISTSQRRQYK